MAEFLFEANVALGNEQYTTVTVQAESTWGATKLIEAQYGYNSIIGRPVFKQEVS